MDLLPTSHDMNGNGNGNGMGLVTEGKESQPIQGCGKGKGEQRGADKALCG